MENLKGLDGKQEREELACNTHLYGGGGASLNELNIILVHFNSRCDLILMMRLI